MSQTDEELTNWYFEGDHEHNLNNLLAVLNGDGGHFQGKHGTRAAIARGLRRYYENIEALDTVRELRKSDRLTIMDLRRKLNG